VGWPTVLGMAQLAGTARELTGDAAREARLRSLLLVPPSARGVVDLVEWFGALQGQDVRSLLWSLGVRLPGATVSSVLEALEQGSVVRTWPMRGTLHLVPARDARWMAGLMAGRKAGAEAARMAQLGIDGHVDRAVDLLCAALAERGRLSRSECLAVLAAAGVPVAGQAGYHLIGQVCKRGLAGMAPEVDGEQTFVLLDAWAPGQRHPDRDEALATVVLRYVRSHGPVTRRDVAGWTGLPLGDVDRGLAACGDVLERVRVADGEQVVHAPSGDTGGENGTSSRLVLPGFDEFVLGYKDRSLVLTPERFERIVPGGNGMFRATLVRGGHVVGAWTRTLTRGRLVVVPEPFEPLGARDRAGFERAFEGFARFWEATSLAVRWPT